MFTPPRTILQLYFIALQQGDIGISEGKGHRSPRLSYGQCGLDTMKDTSSGDPWLILGRGFRIQRMSQHSTLKRTFRYLQLLLSYYFYDFYIIKFVRNFLLCSKKLHLHVLVSSAVSLIFSSFLDSFVVTLVYSWLVWISLVLSKGSL